MSHCTTAEMRVVGASTDDGREGEERMTNKQAIRVDPNLFLAKQEISG
jgi:hypothetical protein